MARCLKPFVKDGVPCPCGKCDPCNKRRASGWSFRILKEAEQLGSAFFITLTYSPENAPTQYEVKDAQGKHIRWQKTKRLTVDIYHLQKFIKRVRKSNLSKKIKYYGVSEYGDETFRPHYHVILMGIDLISFVGIENWELIQMGKLQLDGKDPIHIKDWQLGHVTIGKLSAASCAYTLKYVSKGRKIPQYIGDDRQKEKSLMSKGIGLGYITPQTIKMHNNDIMRQYLVTFDSKKIPIPRYLKERLYDHLERQYVAELFAQKELAERLNMGEIERNKYERKLRKNVDPPTKSSIMKKGKI